MNVMHNRVCRNCEHLQIDHSADVLNFDGNAHNYEWKCKLSGWKKIAIVRSCEGDPVTPAWCKLKSPAKS